MVFNICKLILNKTIERFCRVYNTVEVLVIDMHKLQEESHGMNKSQ